MNASLIKPLARALCALVMLPLPLIASAGDAATPLIDKVRSATARYLELNVALAEGFVPPPRASADRTPGRWACISFCPRVSRRAS